jgi:hypothetical protein
MQDSPTVKSERNVLVYPYKIFQNLSSGAEQYSAPCGSAPVQVI